MLIRDLILARRFTIFLGKNGAGKSTLLRFLDGQEDLNTKYITPERGGELKYAANVEQNMTNDPNWLSSTRRRNRTENFREQSTVQFRNLELLSLREIEKNPAKRQDLTDTFDRVVDRLNAFLPAIRIVRSDRGFSISDRANNIIDEGAISSGESEFIAQAIELLVFSQTQRDGKILLLDEPDVHLHPDLQSRFVGLIEAIAIERDMKVVIATHSTAILSGFSEDADLQVVPIANRNQQEFEAFSRERVSDELLPIFGAHPLSTVFNQSPILLVEGEDDHRVVEQAVRSSNGRLRLNPCVVGTVTDMNKWEQWLETFLPVLYDNPTAFSLRDLDKAQQAEIDDLPIVRRARLHCYSMENLLLTDESFATVGWTSERALAELKRWLESYPDHVNSEGVRSLIEGFDQRRTIKIKDVRNVLLMVMNVTKPWEVHIGQLLASTNWNAGAGEHSLASYLGEKASRLFGRNPA